MLSSTCANEVGDFSIRLQDQINRMKDIKCGVTHLETVDFNQSASLLEREIQNLRHLYNCELKKIRSEIAEAIPHVIKEEYKSEVLERLSADLKQRIADQVQENSRLDNGVSCLKNDIEEKDREISQKKQELMEAESSRKRSTSAGQLRKALHENSELRLILESEVSLNRKAEEKIQQIEHQSQLNSRFAQQQQNVLQDRLSAASNEIMNLEYKLRHHDEHDRLTAKLLAVEEASQQELCRSREETESAFTKKIETLHSQMESGRKDYESVSAENQKLTELIDELNTNITSLQKELVNVENSRRVPEDHTLTKDRGVTGVTDLSDEIKKLNVSENSNLPLQAEHYETKAQTGKERSRVCAEMEERRAETQTSWLASPAYNMLDRYPFLPYSADVSSAHEQAPPSSLPQHPIIAELANEDYSSLRATSSQPRTGYLCNYGNRAQSAPASRSPAVTKQRRMSSAELGKGKDYFDGLFKHKENYERVYSAAQARQRMRVLETPMPKSSLCQLTIHEISKDGRYIMLHNNSPTTDLEFGGYSIKQNLSGMPVTQFTFPQRMTFRAGSFITVFAGVCSPTLHQPPLQFVREEEEKWGTGPECTTVLCNSKGKAVAWVNAPHRHSAMSRHTSESDSAHSSVVNATIRPASKVSARCKTSSTCSQEQLTPENPIYLKRLRDCIGNHCTKLPNIESHKHLSQPVGDESSNARDKYPPRFKGSESRPPHSASGLRMGSAPMRKYTASPSRN